MYADFAFAPPAFSPPQPSPASGAGCSRFVPAEIPLTGLPDLHMGSLLQPSVVSEYDLGGEGDLFKAPEPIIEEPVLGIDPVVAAMISGTDVAAMMSGSDVAAMISGSDVATIISGSDSVIAETMKAADLGSIENDQFLSNVYYECKKDLLEQSAIEESISELLDIKNPQGLVELAGGQEAKSAEATAITAEGAMQKSVSFGCLNSVDWLQGCSIRPSFLEFEGFDLEAALGLRRAYSEGDIQNLGNTCRRGPVANTTVLSSFNQPLTINELKIEERRQKLSRYRKKKVKRNFGRKIKYACRKALADNQPRVRGRFAKIEECDEPKPKK